MIHIEKAEHIKNINQVFICPTGETTWEYFAVKELHQYMWLI